MTSTTVALATRQSAPGAYRPVVLAMALTGLLGVTRIDASLELVGYLLVVVTAFLPAILWTWGGSKGIPVLAAMGAMHLIYYALPVAMRNPMVSEYSAWEVWRSEATVSIFLLVATLASATLTSGAESHRRPRWGWSADSQIVRFAVVGLATGLAFQVALISGWLSVFGSSFGVVRAIGFTCSAAGAYALGIARARGRLHGLAWQVAVTALGATVAVSWSGLFLVMGLVFGAAAVFGYAASSRRVPWRAVVPVFIVVFVLHAGKAEMRDRYWEPGIQGGGAHSLREIPGFAAEWIGTGMSALAAGSMGQDVVDRAALLQMLLFVQQRTPDQVPFLGGATYALLPGMLIPRFLAPEKIASQAAMTLLNVHYGIQTEESAAQTAIGWGPIAEAFANFGYIGVIGAALFIGLFAAAMTRWSAATSGLSLPTVLAIAAMTNLINLEADLTYQIMNLWVALVAAFMFFAAFRAIVPAGEGTRARGRFNTRERVKAPTP